MPRWTFFIDTYGCKINQYESQLLREAWSSLGGQETTQAAQADYIVINSCAITSRGERDARNAVYRARKSAPQAKIILTGCAAQLFGQFTPRKNANYAKPDICICQRGKNRLLNGPWLDDKSSPIPLAPAISDYYRGRPVIKIQDGCSQGCAYCIVPQTRGRSTSRSRQSILAECRQLAANGCGELVLSGINLRQYSDEGDFWDLLAWLDKSLSVEFYGQTRLRISSLDPAMLDGRGLDILPNCSMVCPQLHLSIQHVSSHILTAMRRSHYNARQILAAAQTAAQAWKHLGLGADLLVGFPGESEDDFRELMDFAEQLPLTYAHVFPFSSRPGTIAAKLPRQIHRLEKEKRAGMLRELIEKKKIAFWREQLNMDQMQIAPDMAKEETSGYGRGVNEFYVPCIFTRTKDLGDRKLLPCKPIGIRKDGLEVQIIQRIHKDERTGENR